MRFIALLFFAAGLFGAYQWWSGRDTGTEVPTPSPNGFVQVQMPDGVARNTVLILAPPNCPSEQAQRAESLAQSLIQQGIPVARGSGISFDIVNPTQEQRQGVERAVAVFKTGAPAVFVNGMAMSNPTPSQAAAEYQRTRL